MIIGQKPVEWIDLHPRLASFADDARAGLATRPKVLYAKYFYDARGSELFEEITHLPEYYPTRTELGILKTRASEIASILGEDFVLIEFGSGSSTKVRLLLDKAAPGGTYMPIDISREALAPAAEGLAADYPDLQIIAVCADYSQELTLPDRDRFARRVVFFPGSTVGNFDPSEARLFFRKTAAGLKRGDSMIIGVDLKKDEAILNAAYNDAAGVTAAFNLNLLHRMNRELGANFVPDRFEHEAFYNEADGRIEMHLRSTIPQQASLLGETVPFDQNETIHTESSYKYSVPDFHALVEGTGFEPAGVWIDDGALFSVHHLRVS